MSFSPAVAVIGLGYVGLPLAHALSKHFTVTGYDIDQGRIAELKRHKDRTGELSSRELKATSLVYTDNSQDLRDHDVYIVTVPTPVTADRQPDLNLLISASQTLGNVISKGAIIVFESTVYPGVTEEVCGGELEKASGLTCGKDFFLGYSPERINPGDKKHTVHKIVKVVAGQTPEVAEKLAKMYGAITQVFLAKNIKTAEAAKVIENAQRDINIAFINEVTSIFNKDHISIYDVLAAAQTKWNFLPFAPGLVGGHCIGVDPYYLAAYSQKLGHHPHVILAGRETNDGMAAFYVQRLHAALSERPSTEVSGKPSILVLGVTFKENVPDTRNSKVVDIIHQLKALGYEVTVIDPYVTLDDAQRLGLPVYTSVTEVEGKRYDAVIGAVAHEDFKSLTKQSFQKLTTSLAVIYDIKNIWPSVDLPPNCRRLLI